MNYWLDAVDEHSLHSPFLFDFYTNIIKKNGTHPEWSRLKDVRRKLESDHTIIHVTDFGIGSQGKNSVRRISDIARTSATPAKYTMLYANIITCFNFNSILELGTSLGITTLYMSTAHPATNVVTFEGSPETAGVARKLFEASQVTNIQIIEGNIDLTLPQYLSSAQKIDFVLIDANHRYQPTLQYFDWLMEKIHSRSLIVIDDIYYSHEMERAWTSIRTHELVYATIDLHRCGIVLFNPSLNRQNVVLQF